MVSAFAAGELKHAIDFAREAYDERGPLLVLVVRNFHDTQGVRNQQRFPEVLRRFAFPTGMPVNQAEGDVSV